MIKMPSHPSSGKKNFVYLHFLLLQPEENVFLHTQICLNCYESLNQPALF